MTKQKDYDTTVARIAGNIAPVFAARYNVAEAARLSVKLAHAIMAETKRTQPQEQTFSDEGMCK